MNTAQDTAYTERKTKKKARSFFKTEKFEKRAMCWTKVGLE
jgi:hypothetical protein